MPRKKKPTPADKIDLAVTYLADGALHTAATLLLEASQEIEAIANKRGAMLDKLVGKVKAK